MSIYTKTASMLISDENCTKNVLDILELGLTNQKENDINIYLMLSNWT